MSNYIKLTNKGAYVAFSSVGYDLNGQRKVIESPYLPVLQSYTTPIPDGATNIIFVSVMYEDLTGGQIISSDKFNAPQTVCYECYGTIFNPSCQKVPCTGLGGGNPDIPKPPCCCCCNCKPSCTC